MNSLYRIEQLERSRARWMFVAIICLTLSILALGSLSWYQLRVWTMEVDIAQERERMKSLRILCPNKHKKVNYI